MTQPRASKLEIAQRIEKVLKLRLNGASLTDLIDIAVEKGWNVTERQLARYVAKADDVLAQRTEKRRRRIIAVALARREALYAKCLNAADYATGLRVLADLAKLQDLYSTSGDVKELAKLVATQNAQIRELTGRLDAAGKTPKDGEAERLPDCPADGRDADSHGPDPGLPGAPRAADG